MTVARRWLILADDLTGAADCAIAFARRGRSTGVQWGEAVGGAEDDVVSHDGDSRPLGPQVAAARHAALLDRLQHPDRSPGRSLFKKIDSTLRGQRRRNRRHPRRDAPARDGAAFAILAPAFPATGRTTRDGRILVEGRPLEETELWRGTTPMRRVAARDAGGGRSAKPHDRARDRAGRARGLERGAGRGGGGGGGRGPRRRHRRRLARIAEAGLAPGLPENLVWVGSAGLAHALRRGSRRPAARPPRHSPPGPAGPSWVVGSLAAASRARRAPSRGRAGLAPRPGRAGPAVRGRRGRAGTLWRDAVTPGLIAGDDVLVEVAMGEAPDSRSDHASPTPLGALLSPSPPSRRAGGDGRRDRRALLAHFRIDGLRLIDEIEAGVSLGLTRGALRVRSSPRPAPSARPRRWCAPSITSGPSETRVPRHEPTDRRDSPWGMPPASGPRSS